MIEEMFSMIDRYYAIARPWEAYSGNRTDIQGWREDKMINNEEAEMLTEYNKTLWEQAKKDDLLWNRRPLT